ncbi:MAG: putative bifunctional diguanylate cyclase/phosphodiesterase [Actinomycetes bacterium]
MSTNVIPRQDKGTPGSAWARHRLVVTVGAATAVATALVVVGIGYDIGRQGPRGWQLVATVVALMVADSALIDVRTGHDAESVTFAEAMLAVSLLLVPWSFLLPLAGMCVAIAHSLRGRALIKTMFNAASFVIGTALASLVISFGHVEPLRDIGAADVAVVALAVFVFWVWNGAATARVVSLAAHRPIREIYCKAFALRSVVGIGNLIAGLGIVVLARWSPPALAVLPPILVLLYVVYRGYLSATRDVELWRQLEIATKEITQLDERAVADAVLRNAVELFQADWAELVIPDEEGRPKTYSEPKSSASGRPFQILSAETCAVARLGGPDGDLGVLRLGVAPQVRLSRREMQALTTYARTVTTTLINVRLHEAVRRQAAHAAHEASHDALTGLPNRSLLLARAREALVAAQENGSNVALLLLDLDHFKEINDTLGHAAGDILLRHVADRLRTAVPEEATIARFGGDEFAVLMPGLRGVLAVALAAEKLLGALSEPVAFEGMRLSIEGSMGVACYPADGDTVEELLQRSDVAMYQAKDDRGAWRLYDAERDESSLDRIALVAELRTAMERDELVTYFQPQINLDTGTIAGYEALIRWRHPQRGLLSPRDFVAVAEHSGLVRSFALHVLDRAIAECAGWQRDGAPVSVAVNLSARNLLDRQLSSDVSRVLRRHGVEASSLVLEITETTMMSELEVVEEVLASLRTLGVRLSVDDFGTGYSSLALLQRVAVNEVKIDRAFVANMLTSASDMAIVRATVELAHNLGLQVVAEGVESAALCDALASLGCDLAQGYHLGVPAPASDVGAALRTTGTTTERVPGQRRPRLAVLGGTGPDPH